ncbi:hypothetical protein HDV05_002832 [Chytridiales sp. JEL 0842]|nr:hypothetical protein HDV05_002832 [Chytridiales sp. JEL 0842]
MGSFIFMAVVSVRVTSGGLFMSEENWVLCGHRLPSNSRSPQGYPAMVLHNLQFRLTIASLVFALAALNPFSKPADDPSLSNMDSEPIAQRELAAPQPIPAFQIQDPDGADIEITPTPADASTSNTLQSNSNWPPRITHIDPDSHQFIDSHHRSRMFHGLNVVYKKPPYHPSTQNFHPTLSFSSEDIEIFHNLTLNIVRLGVHWAGVEPERGVYNETYLKVIKGIIQDCAEKGIYVLVEWHQDLLARQFCGHGMPDWVVKSDWQPMWRRFPFPLRLRPFEVGEDGIPSKEDCSKLTWYLAYLTPAVADAFGKFYTNHGGIFDSFLAFWRKVATEFKGMSNVIGYEVINEPWPGNHFQDPTLLIPGRASTSLLFNFHDRVARAIRSVDSSALIFFEGVTWESSTNYEKVPGGHANMSVSSYHYYKPPSASSPSAAMQNRVLKDSGKLLGVGTMLTEFAMWEKTGGGNGGEYRVEVMRAADEWLQSWIGWSYKSFQEPEQPESNEDGGLFDPSGKRRAHVEKLLSRPYSFAVAGRILRMSYNDTIAEFTLCYLVKESATAPTEIALQADILYPTGFNVTIEPSSWALQSFEKNVVYIRHTDKAISNEKLCVCIT